MQLISRRDSLRGIAALSSVPALLLSKNLKADEPISAKEKSNNSLDEMNGKELQAKKTLYESCFGLMNPSVNDLFSIPIRRFYEAKELIERNIALGENSPDLDLKHRTSFIMSASWNAFFVALFSYFIRLPSDLYPETDQSNKHSSNFHTMNVFHMQTFLLTNFSSEIVKEITEVYESILTKHPEFNNNAWKVPTTMFFSYMKKKAELANAIGRGVKGTAESIPRIFNSSKKKRLAFDFLLFMTSYLHPYFSRGFTNDAFGKAVATLHRAGPTSRRQLERIPETQEKYNENRARCSASIITNPAFYVVNSAVQYPLFLLPSISSNTRVNANFSDFIGKLIATPLYMKYKVDGQHSLELKARDGFRNSEEKLWTKLIKPYIVPENSQFI